MKKLIGVIIFMLWGINSFSQNETIDIKRIEAYHTFLKKTNLSAKDYILYQFKQHDVVILAERFHYEETQYELINDIIRPYHVSLQGANPYGGFRVLPE